MMTAAVGQSRIDRLPSGPVIIPRLCQRELYVVTGNKQFIRKANVQ